MPEHLPDELPPFFQTVFLGYREILRVLDVHARRGAHEGVSDVDLRVPALRALSSDEIHGVIRLAGADPEVLGRGDLHLPGERDTGRTRPLASEERRGRHLDVTHAGLGDQARIVDPVVRNRLHEKLEPVRDAVLDGKRNGGLRAVSGSLVLETGFQLESTLGEEARGLGLQRLTRPGRDRNRRGGADRQEQHDELSHGSILGSGY